MDFELSQVDTLASFFFVSPPLVLALCPVSCGAAYEAQLGSEMARRVALSTREKWKEEKGRRNRAGRCDEEMNPLFKGDGNGEKLRERKLRRRQQLGSREAQKNWMWRRNLKPNNVVGSSQLISHDPAWEEKAFTEDSAGLLGAYIWPPRSYSCSFCRREFRSAQALGGHMNSHRRDRARLKQWADQEGIVPSRTNNVVALPSHHLSLIRVSEVSSTTAAAAAAAASSTASFADLSRRKRDMEDEESFRMKRWRVEEESFKLLAPCPVKEEQLDLELSRGFSRQASRGFSRQASRGFSRQASRGMQLLTACRWKPAAAGKPLQAICHRPSASTAFVHLRSACMINIHGDQYGYSHSGS
ncbi:hypothetical protein ZIOFF_042439 [Zingiber officinale]|uniref:C2H2-type domain-containing protein n=1 Tax=Zingiber officinale TaxID=94328 RepID=A0A8J5KNR7_ZINOF|nr:hypothetical protein ZIOFF_042439 [Zingiber officinale]